MVGWLHEGGGSGDDKSKDEKSTGHFEDFEVLLV
jgi:hypothetical protein